MDARKVFAFAVMGLTCPAVARAADMPTARPMPVKAAPTIAPAFSWAGLYIGVHGGYVSGREKSNYSEPFCGSECTVSGTIPGDNFDLDGFIAGGHVGYNWQSGQFVFGIEADDSVTGLKGKTDFSYPDIFGPDTTNDNWSGTVGLRSVWQGSLRLRAGYAIDTTLLYVTGGVALARSKLAETQYDADDSDGIPHFYSNRSDTQWHVGWTLGGGVEHAFAPNWIGRLEARYTDFGKQSFTMTDGYIVAANWTQVAVTGGISYKFSPAADLPSARSMPVKAAPMIATAFSWTGFYIGAHGGYVSGREKDNQNTLRCSDCTFDLDGFVAGGHIGYNRQSGQFVFGIEADQIATGLKGDSGMRELSLAGDSGTLVFRSTFQGSGRLRAGYAIDTTLLYVTGGVAYAEGKIQQMLYNPNGSVYGNARETQSHVGWTFGGGIEHAFAPHWIGRLEARYTDFGNETYSLANDATVDAGWTQVSVIGGISYKY